MPNGGPYLIAAALCEKVLTEADGAPSLIRIVDRMTFYTAPEAKAEPLVAGLTLFIAFRGSRPGAKHFLRITATNADGVAAFPDRDPTAITVADGADGANVGFLLHSPFPGPGRYLFTIWLDDRELTRVPLSLVTAELPESLRPPKSPPS
jgi:hypothetical protein